MYKSAFSPINQSHTFLIITLFKYGGFIITTQSSQIGLDSYRNSFKITIFVIFSGKMPYCAIAGCNTGNARIPDVNHFQCFNLPKSEDIKEKWLEKIKLNRSDFAPSSHTVICEKHFRRYDFISDTQNLDRRGKTKKKKKLKLKAIPSLYMSGDLIEETWNYSDNIGDDQYQSDDNEGN